MTIDTAISVSCNLCGCESSRLLFIKKGFRLLQCLSCGLIYVGNPPSGAELRELYCFDSGYHNRFQDTTSWQTKRQLRVAKRHYGYIRNYIKKGRMLDIGCSAGFFLKIAKENGWEVFGLEISSDTAEIARKRYGLNVLTGILNEDTFPAGHFDVVTMLDVIEHVNDPARTMTIVKKIVAPAGIVVLSTPNIDGIFPRLAYRMSGRMNDWLHPEPPYHLFQFSKKTICKLLDNTGLEPLKIYDKRMPISYIFRSSELLRGPLKRLLYSVLLMPMSMFGSMVGSGDSIIVVARKGKAR